MINYLFINSPNQDEERVVAKSTAGGGSRQVLVERIGQDTTIGTLTIPKVTSQDAGEYTCAPASLQSASVRLHVLNGN